MNIQPMCASDVPQVAALEAETFSRPWDEAALLAELENPLSRWLVAAEGERVLGYVPRLRMRIFSISALRPGPGAGASAAP